MFKLVEPYQKRPIRFLELWEKDGWRLKVYSLAYQMPLARAHVVETSKTVLWKHLQEVARDKPHYSVGFIGINDGRGAIFSFVDFWADENELHHHVFVSPKEEVEKLEYRTPTGLTACVWDAALLAFERQAWVDTMLNNPDEPSLEQYLLTQMNQDV
ncbi:MAG: isochorismatase [Chloroflexi bacterium CFX2]|nr:isochorismatase [Chloroflexi bacterium CFX2]